MASLGGFINECSKHDTNGHIVLVSGPDLYCQDCEDAMMPKIKDLEHSLTLPPFNQSFYTHKKQTENH